MIRLTRPAIPAKLAAAAPAATQRLINAWVKKEKLQFEAGVYAHEDVKTALRNAQHNKCAYCETLNPTSHDVIEHYRPKNGWRQDRKDKLNQHEYFWLAYDWENLLFACDQCNDGGHKQNLFPLVHPGHRATSAARDTRREVALIINPYGSKDPEKHIAWNKDIPRPRNGSRFGRVTIDTFRLAESSLLLDERRKYLVIVEKLLSAVEESPVGGAKRAAAKSVFLDYIGPKGQWSAMLRTNLGARISAL